MRKSNSRRGNVPGIAAGSLRPRAQGPGQGKPGKGSPGFFGFSEDPLSLRVANAGKKHKGSGSVFGGKTGEDEPVHIRAGRAADKAAEESGSLGGVKEIKSGEIVKAYHNFEGIHRLFFRDGPALSFEKAARNFVVLPSYVVQFDPFGKNRNKPTDKAMEIVREFIEQTRPNLRSDGLPEHVTRIVYAIFNNDARKRKQGSKSGLSSDEIKEAAEDAQVITAKFFAKAKAFGIGRLKPSTDEREPIKAGIPGELLDSMQLFTFLKDAGIKDDIVRNVLRSERKESEDSIRLMEASREKRRGKSDDLDRVETRRIRKPPSKILDGAIRSVAGMRNMIDPKEIEIEMGKFSGLLVEISDMSNTGKDSKTIRANYQNLLNQVIENYNYYVDKRKPTILEEIRNTARQNDLQEWEIENIYDTAKLIVIAGYVRTGRVIPGMPEFENIAIARGLLKLECHESAVAVALYKALQLGSLNKLKAIMSEADVVSDVDAIIRHAGTIDEFFSKSSVGEDPRSRSLREP